MVPSDTGRRESDAGADPDLKAVARVSKRIDLESVRLWGLHVEGNTDPKEIPEDWAKNMFVGVSAHRHGPEDGDLLAARDFSAHASFLAVYKRGFEAEEEPPEYDPDDPPDFVVEGTFELRYLIQEDAELAPEDVEEFVKVNAPYQAWPYWRELAHSACQRVGIYPPFIAPALRLPSKHDSE